MEKEMTIIPPEGYEIDKENSTFEKIVFKQINKKPKSFNELPNLSGFYVTTASSLNRASHCIMDDENRNIWPTKELAEASLALSQLTQLRKAWIGDWEPNWKTSTPKFCISVRSEEIMVDIFWQLYFLLSFPTSEMAEEFCTTFKDLLIIAKPLL